MQRTPADEVVLLYLRLRQARMPGSPDDAALALMDAALALMDAAVAIMDAAVAPMDAALALMDAAFALVGAGLAHGSRARLEF